jgi:ABC-type dipeptide/oligopeptide/nickel transport system permease component
MLISRIARRLAGSVLVLILASLVAFTILDFAPGDAAEMMIGEGASEEQMLALRRELGLDVPFLNRYLNYLSSAARGDLGVSLINGRPVTKIIGERFGSTLLLAVVATALAACLGVMIGTWAASHKGSLADMGIMSLTSLGLAVPGFGFAMLLTLVFPLKLRLLPVAGGGSLAHLVLPTLTLAAPLLAVIARLSRSSLLDAAQADYVLTARAKGASHTQVWRKHILRNALVPVITLLGLNFGHLLGGAFVVETIFGWPGLGRLLVQAVFDRDYPLILGAVLLLAVIFQVFNLLIDLLHGVLDPRVGSEAV